MHPDTGPRARKGSPMTTTSGGVATAVYGKLAAALRGDLIRPAGPGYGRTPASASQVLPRFFARNPPADPRPTACLAGEWTAANDLTRSDGSARQECMERIS